MKITILCVGKIKEKFYRDAIAEYEKRLSRYCKLEIIEVADEKTPESAGEALEEQIREKEGERMLARLSKFQQTGAFVCALAIDGRQLDSVELSRKIETLGTGGTSHIVFLIGGSLGMSDALLKCADFRLSFSKMTFPHQLMRVILLEQIYRAYRIMSGEPYHK
ncbi:MAG: 23S rRNA (pseudouridine(1915)-N(3))-methyltransferase RlmH [Roseburia sp.]|nr:23S rRNA (pseudouridine(1915)-N(3))-methyltransferase RlmH [Roseburia sp.]